MKGLLTLVTVVIVLAIVRAALAALVLALAVALLVSFVTRPRETLVFVGTLLLFGLASAQPTAFIVTLGVVALTVVIVDALRKSRRRLLVTDGPEHRSPGPAG